MPSDIYIYHEQQESLLCGQHCLNNLLQGPYFTPDTLSEIANELDRKERSLISSTTFTPSFNVDDSGNFSIQVLRQAIQNLMNLDLILWGFQQSSSSSTTAQEDPLQHQGFVINRSSHWFTIRRIHNTWWNLDSKLPRPEIISSMYLSAYLYELRQSAHCSIFVLSGSIQDQGNYELFRSSQHVDGVWYREQELLHPSSQGNKPDDGPKFQAFQGKGNRLGAEGEVIYDTNEPYDEDIALAQAISASLETATVNPKDDVRAKRLAALSRLGIN